MSRVHSRGRLHRQGAGAVWEVMDSPEGSISFDSNILSYFLQANSGLYDPTTDLDARLATERIAAYRLFLYGPKAVDRPQRVDGIGGNSRRGEARRARPVDLLQSARNLTRVV